jgi:hypothetical protein
LGAIDGLPSAVLQRLSIKANGCKSAYVLIRQNTAPPHYIAFFWTNCSAAILYFGFVVFYLTHQIGKACRGEVCNFPKLLLLSIVIPLHWIAFAYASTLPVEEGLLVAGVATNIGHSLQYQRLTWFHNRNRYAGASRSTIGLARSSIFGYQSFS